MPPLLRYPAVEQIKNCSAAVFPSTRFINWIGAPEAIKLGTGQSQLHRLKQLANSSNLELFTTAGIRHKSAPRHYYLPLAFITLSESYLQTFS